MFFQRLLSSIILMVITITLLIVGGNPLFMGLLAISLIGMMELYRTINLHKSILAFFAYLASICYYITLYFQEVDFTLISIMFLLLIMTVYVVTFPKYKTEEITFIFFGLFYVGIMLSFIYKVRILENGEYLIWLIFISAWGTDTSAYSVGMLFGKRKFLPNLSPKKSLEGAIGGVGGAAILGLIYGLIFREKLTIISNPIVILPIICAMASIISQLGDLAASAIKRNHNIKDYGKLIPGHGGIIDRFDSILFVAPIVYYLIEVLK